jgi:hypothetical protein
MCWIQKWYQKVDGEMSRFSIPIPEIDKSGNKEK